MIRKAVAEDAAAIADIWNWMIRETLATFTTDKKSPVDIRALIAGRDGAFFVAEEGGHIQGFMTFGPFRAGPGYARMVEHSVVISPDAKGAGVGRSLMECGQHAARAAGHRVMIGALSSANPDAVKFHEKLGFAQVGLLPQVGHKRGEWLDLLLMQKNL